jgi:peptidoglycan hydrolase-like protein with peptidoglycan-binding domain
VAVYIGHHLYKSWALDYGRYAYVWIPRYGSNNGKPQTPPDYPCDIWQYTSKGNLPGISGDVDLDRLMGTKPLSYFTNPTDEKERDTMATVKIGSARIDENGNATGGKAGDQTGKEVSTQNWYKHSKGWRVLRAKDAEAAEKIAQAMQWACDSPLIGYDQNQRETLRKAVMPLGWDIRKLTTAVETDCSALVRVCCGWAFQKDLGTDVSYFNTTTMCQALLKTGLFNELTGSRYTDQQDYLRRGDILCTKTQGHTVVVLSNGSRAGDTVNGLSKGDYGTAVTALQKALLAWDATCLPRFGADGDFGSETEKALKAFQAAEGLPVTGVYDEATRKALTEKPTPPVDDDGTGDSELSDDPVQSIEPTGRYVEILPIHVRSAPGDQYMSLGTVQQGYRLPYQGETHQDDNGVPWHLVEYDGQNGWVCGKCSEIVQ